MLHTQHVILDRCGEMDGIGGVGYNFGYFYEPFREKKDCWKDGDRRLVTMQTRYCSAVCGE